MYSSILQRAALIGYSKPRVERARRMLNQRVSVSVIIPCYNYGHYLLDCAMSVLDQQNVDVDILIIDDASTDGSIDVVRRLASEQPRIRAIYHKKNAGALATYNEGISQARGDYTILISADDLLTPGSLARATALMETHSSVGLVYGFAVRFADVPVPSARTVASHWIIWRGEDWIADRCVAGRNIVESPTAVMRTSVLHKIGGFHPDLPHAGDFEMWMRIGAVSDIGWVGGADQAYYRLHQRNMHHTTFTLLDDLSQRRLAFDCLLSLRLPSLFQAEKMSAAAHQALAREALSYAMRELSLSPANQGLIEEYATFVLETWPDAKLLPEWRSLRPLRELNRWQRWYLWRALSLQYGLRSRRLRLCGVELLHNRLQSHCRQRDLAVTLPPCHSAEPYALLSPMPLRGRSGLRRPSFPPYPGNHRLRPPRPDRSVSPRSSRPLAWCTDLGPARRVAVS